MSNGSSAQTPHVSIAVSCRAQTQPLGGISRLVRLLKKTSSICYTALKNVGRRRPGTAPSPILQSSSTGASIKNFITASPTARVRALSTARSRDRVLTADEPKWVWRALKDHPGVFGPLFKVLLLTGQRRGEVAGLRWDEIRDLGTNHALWDLPPKRTKNGQPHLVPLSPAVQNLLLELSRTGPLAFTTTSTTAVSGFSRAKDLLDERITLLRAEGGLPPMPIWTLHDLRRTMVTHMNEHLGVAPHVVEAVVNHISGPAKRGVAGVYNRALYLAERRVALNAWAASFEALKLTS